MIKVYSIFLIFMMLLSGKTDETIKTKVYSWNDLEVKKQETRESRAILEGTTTHLSYFEVHATTLLPGKMPHSSHSHQNDEEVILVREGKIKIQWPGGEKILGPGGVAILMPQEEHGLVNAGKNPATYYILKYRSKSPMNLDRGSSEGGTQVIDRTDALYKEHEKGGRWNYFDRPTVSCEDFDMHATHLKPNISSHAPHTHVQEEIILMIKGTGRMHIDGKEYPVAAGDLVFLESMVPHGITNSGNDTCEYFAFQWK